MYLIKKSRIGILSFKTDYFILRRNLFDIIIYFSESEETHFL